MAKLQKRGSKAQKAIGRISLNSIRKKKVIMKRSEAPEMLHTIDSQHKTAEPDSNDPLVSENCDDFIKLQKRIKELEEDLEDALEDLSDSKKRLKKKSEESKTFQNKLSELEAEQKKLIKDKDKVVGELKKSEEKLSLKTQTLSFVQEVLSAKEFSSQDLAKMNADINFLEAFINGQYLDLNKYLFDNFDIAWNEKKGSKGFEEEKNLVLDLFIEWAASKRKNWLYQKTTIAFVGEFSAGKTTIVNRILSQNDPSFIPLPVDVKASTAIPTYIVGGESTIYTFISKDLKQKRIQENTFKRISKEILEQVKGVSSLIQYFVMISKSPNLNGMTILDTPGFNSNDNDDNERTLEAINECDALFWVFDVQKGDINKTSIDLIKEHLKKPLYIVINRVDTKSNSAVNMVEEQIKGSFERQGIKVESIIRFSIKQPLEDILKPIHSVKRIVSRDTFVDLVKSDIEEWLEWFDNEVKIYNKKYNEARKGGEELDDELSHCIRSIRDDCNKAHDIPKFVEHLIRKNRYEMNKSDGKRFKSLLNKITKNSIKDLERISEERVKKAEEIEISFQELCKYREARRKLTDCQQQYNKIINKI